VTFVGFALRSRGSVTASPEDPTLFGSFLSLDEGVKGVAVHTSGQSFAQLNVL